jgi:phosphoribosylformylglycinamidine synthase I
VRVAVLRFPGSNCDEDAVQGLQDAGCEAVLAWHEESSLRGFDGVWIPGGFSYGDYLRCGAIAARSPVVEAVREFAKSGGPVIGVCNGFQILCEAGMLPGALLANSSQKFVCDDVWLRAEGKGSVWTAGADRLLRIPVAHGEGRFTATSEELSRLEGEGRVAFRYVDRHGDPAPGANPNGSANGIAGILGPGGNVLGMMPHPERATREYQGSTDGLVVVSAFHLVQTA